MAFVKISKYRYPIAYLSYLTTVTEEYWRAADFTYSEEDGNGEAWEVGGRVMYDQDEFVQLVDERIAVSNGRNIQYVTNVFRDAALASDKYVYTTDEILSLKADSGVFIFPDGLTMIYYYLFEDEEKQKPEELKLCCFMGKTLIANLAVGIDERLTIYGRMSKTFVTEHTKESIVKLFFCIQLIKKLAPLEIKIIEPKNSTRSYANDSLKNSFGAPVTILDSTWNTTTIRVGEFPVSSHLRYQACGKGHSQRKWVWVHGYAKKGYVRIAKKLKQI